MAKRKRRTFTPGFKTEGVLEALSGESSHTRQDNTEDNLLNEITGICNRDS